MSLRALLVGPQGHGGEGAYMASLVCDPPDGVSYELCDRFHRGTPGAPCAVVREVLLNQIVHRITVPDMGFRALRVRDRYDVVHVHAHPVVLSGLDGVPLVMSEGSSSAVYLGDYLGWGRTRIRNRYARARRLYRRLGVHDRLLALERVSRAYVFSNWAREVNIGWGADGDKLEVIYPGFPTPKPIKRSDRDRFTFLFVGGDFERKGGFEVVEAFAQLADQFPEAHLVLAGSDPGSPNPDRSIHSWVPRQRRQRGEELMGQLERRGRVTRHGWVGAEPLRSEIFPAADAFVMPSWAEGFGLANVEAMSFALPVITSAVGPAAEIVGDGATGLLVSPGDVDALRDAMARLIGDPAVARRLGDAGRTEFERRFTMERLRHELGDLYRRVVEE